MKKGLLFACFCLALFACTIEKRHYYKGYHVDWSSARSATPENNVDRNLSVPVSDSTLNSASSCLSVRQDSQVVVSNTDKEQDCSLNTPKADLIVIDADQMAPLPGARVSQNLDSTQLPINWTHIILEHQADFEFDDLLNEPSIPKRDPLETLDIVKSFLTGLSAIFLGVVLILMSGNEGSFFKGMLPFGIFLAIIGLVIVIVSAIRTRKSDAPDRRVMSNRKSIGLFKRGVWKP